MQFILWLAVVLVSVFSCSCSMRKSFVLSSYASKNLNALPSGKGSALAIKIYQLSSSAAMQSCDLLGLQFQGDSCMQSAVLKQQSLILLPGKSQATTIAWDKQARALAVVAFFRASIGSSWRQVLTVNGYMHFFPVGFRLQAYKNKIIVRLERWFA